MYSTTHGSGSVRSRGSWNQPRTDSPFHPANVTSNVSIVVNPLSYGTNRASSGCARTSPSVPAQNSSKSAGSVRSGRYSRSLSSEKSNSGIGPPRKCGDGSAVIFSNDEQFLPGFQCRQRSMRGCLIPECGGGNVVLQRQITSAHTPAERLHGDAQILGKPHRIGDMP